MSGKNKGILLLVAGVLIFLVALSADSLGLGSSPGVGAKQIIMAAVGVIATIAGAVTMRRAGKAAYR